MVRAVRYMVLSGVALCAVLAGPITAAQASNNSLRATLNSYAGTIVKDENAVKAGLNGYPKGKVKPLVRALTTEIRDLRALRFKLSKDSASNAKGEKARRKIVKGLGLIASAYGALRGDVKAAHGGAVSPAKVNAAIQTDKRGRKLLTTGLTLLDHAG